MERTNGKRKLCIALGKMEIVWEIDKMLHTPNIVVVSYIYYTHIALINDGKKFEKIDYIWGINHFHFLN